MVHGACLVADGEVDTGVAAMRQGLAEWQGTGSRSLLSGFLSFLAEGLAAQGHEGQALETLQEARRFAAETGEGMWLTEIHRVHGEVLAASPRAAAPAEAEVALATAIDLARSQGARALEERARASLDAIRRERPAGRPTT